MQHHYFVLKRLAEELNEFLPGSTLAESFSQTKNELTIGFVNEETQKEVYLRAMTDPAFACLTVDEHFSRARRNSADVFEEVVGLNVSEVGVFENERALWVQFSEDFYLVFKMFGPRSNVLLFQDENPVSIFRKKMGEDHQLKRSALHRNIDQSYEAFCDANGDVQALFPTFGKEVRQYLQDNDYDNLDLKEQWELVSKVRTLLLYGEANVVRNSEGVLAFTLLNTKQHEVVYSAAQVTEALSYFYRGYLGSVQFVKEKNQAIKSLDKKINKNIAYIEKSRQVLQEKQERQSYEEYGHLLMAYLHEVKPGATSVVLKDFYTEQPVEIPLKKELSPQKNAERYYRKSKNEQVEVDNIQQNIQRKEEELLELYEVKEQLEQADTLKSLRKNTKEARSSIQSKQEKQSPFKEAVIDGFQVLIGKNAKNNDELTLKYAKKDDLWLHAKDVTGSHVVIKHQAGKTISEATILKTAALAAWYSKRKTDSMCPVIVTPAKYVRKMKGAPFGAVIVDREERVVMVQPKAVSGQVF